MDTEEVSSIVTNSSSNIDSKHCNFMLKSTSLPDIYELYVKSKSQSYEKYSYASIPDIYTSKLLKKFITDSDSEDILVECKYNKKFKKWIPIKLSTRIDNINHVNKIQSLYDE